MHNFSECLKQSHAASDLPFWEVTYKRAFPNMVAMVDHRGDGWHQRAGVDRSIVLDNSKQILIDEKVRGRNKKTGRVYEDIALEFLSDRDRNEPGWVCKSLAADYIAYAIAPLGRCYLLPVTQLQSAWNNNSEDWLQRFRTIEAQNAGWVTLSLAVPVGVLFPAIGSELRIDFDPFEMDEGRAAA